MELTDTQKSILEFAADMKTPMIVKGAAGSGKSMITALIAETFLNREMLTDKNSIGVVSFTNALVKDLRKKFPQSAESLKINTAHETLNLFLEANGKKRIITFDKENTVLKQIVSDQLNQKHNYDFAFLEEEFSHIYANRITDLEKYKSTPRTGLTRNVSVDKPNIWDLFTKYKKLLKENGLYNYSELANICLEFMEQNPSYNHLLTHLIIDEFQDLQINMTEALVKICKYPDNIVFIGDLAQSIYKRVSTWKSFSVNKRKIFELTGNFRNTKQIAKAAESLLDNEYKLKLYDRADYTEMIPSGAQGPKPVVAICRNAGEQEWYIKNELKNLPKDESTVLILRSKSRSRRSSGINRLFNESNIITMHSSKGLEFDNVFIADVNENFLPGNTASDKGKAADLNNERRLLYVAMTRARKRLYITSSGKPSCFLAEISPARINSVALDSCAYEELYNRRFEELLEKRAALLKQLSQEKENQTLSQKEEAALLLAIEQEFVEDKLTEMGKPLFRKNAKILFLGGDGGVNANDLYYTLKKLFGFDKDSFEWLHFEELQNFNIQILEGTMDYCDVIIGCAPHNSGGSANFVAELEQNREKYTPKIQVLRDVNGALAKFTKKNITEAVKNSLKLTL